MSNKIPLNLYKKILTSVPIICVDVIISNKNNFLMVFRNTEPAKNQWWLPGGRVFKFETLEQAALRKAREETGLECRINNQVLTDNTIFSTGPNNIPVHSVNVCYSLYPLSKQPKVALDSYSDNYKWFKGVNPKWHPYIIKCLIMKGYKIDNNS